MPEHNRDRLTDPPPFDGRRTDSAAKVLALLLEGEQQTAIAKRLHLSSETVAHIAQRHCHRAGLRTTSRLVCTLWAKRVAALEATVAEQQACIAGLEDTLRLLDMRRNERQWWV